MDTSQTNWRIVIVNKVSSKLSLRGFLTVGRALNIKFGKGRSFKICVGIHHSITSDLKNFFLVFGKIEICRANVSFYSSSMVQLKRFNFKFIVKCHRVPSFSQVTLNPVLSNKRSNEGSKGFGLETIKGLEVRKTKSIRASIINTQRNKFLFLNLGIVFLYNGFHHSDLS